MLRTQARFPDVPAGKGHYESFYLKACHPSEPVGIWIRYTVHKHSGAKPQGSLWFTLFDGNADGPQASKVTTADISAPDDAYIRIADSTFVDGRVRGTASTEQLDASWELTLRLRPGAALPPGTRLDVPRPRAEDEAALAVSGRALRRHRPRGGEGGVGRGLARDDRPQLGDPARGALDLAPRRGFRGGRRRLARRRDRQDQARAGHDAVDRERDALHGRGAAPPGRAREGAWDARDGDADRGATSCCPAETSRSAAGSSRTGRTSSDGSTRTRTGRSTTRSTARSPT